MLDTFTTDLFAALSSACGSASRNDSPALATLAPSTRAVLLDRPTGDSRAPFALHGIDLAGGGAKSKFRANLEAIEILRRLDRCASAATHEEQIKLAQYVGWGGLPQAFRHPDTGAISAGWEKEVEALEALLPDAELASARRSTQDAHYTPANVIAAIYAGVQRLGFEGGRVLEPASGTGNFIGLAPAALRDRMQFTCVELDSITARISERLYPEAKHHAGRAFQDVRLPENGFDLAIGNPPFGRTVIFDAQNRDLRGLSIHNYFLCKAVKLLRPGGILAMVVTRRFLDAANSAALRFLAPQVSILGAFRLPNNAFLANAGTEVTADVVFLRKRVPGEMPQDDELPLSLELVDDAHGGEPIPVNAWFAQRPRLMLGRMARERTQFRTAEPTLLPDDGRDLEPAMAEAISKLPASIYSPARTQEQDAAAPEVPVPAGLQPYHHFIHDGQLYQVQPNGAAQLASIEPRHGARMVGLLSVREAMRALFDAELCDAPEREVVTARARLNDVYDRFVKRFGYLNSPMNTSLFRTDADAYRVRALEVDYIRLDAEEAANKGFELPKGRKTLEMATKAAIFSRRVLRAPAALSASTAQDALSISLNVNGRVDLPFMAALLGVDEAELLRDLNEALYFDPAHKTHVTRDAYLSGNVKAKLAIARAAVVDDPTLERNVVALEAVQPSDLSPADIYVGLGAPWVPVADYEAFAHQALGLSGNILFVESQQLYSCALKGGDSRFGTSRMKVAEVFEKALNRHAIKVRDRQWDGSYVLNPTETDAANMAADAIREGFDEWIWSERDRRERLARLYNDRFNTDVVRAYDGSHLTFPGKVDDSVIALRPNQVNAIWRGIQEGRLLVDQVVGSGKTWIAVAIAMEMRRMGLIRKPLFAVPNHLVEQWAADFVRLYPSANILAVGKDDFSRDRRKMLFARIATGEWDAVIIAHSQLQRIAVPKSYQVEFLYEQLSELESALHLLDSSDGHHRTVKRAEQKRDQIKETIKAKLDDTGRDQDVPDMVEMGVDTLVVDEAHAFKNLCFTTGKHNVAGIGNPEGSAKAFDLYLKTRYLASTQDGRGVFFLSGTPISNSLSEMFTIQRYLAHDDLVQRGIHHFDLWANTFAHETVEFELDSSGRGLKPKTVLKRFSNVPEMMAIYRRIADTLTLSQLKQLHKQATGEDWPIPGVVGGGPENVVVPAGEVLSGYIDQVIIPRMQKVCGEKGRRPDPREDNMLRITNDARLAALDVRLRIANAADDPESKVNAALRNTLDIYHEWTDRRGVQLVFCDLSTPSSAMDAEARHLRALILAAQAGDEDAREAVDGISPDQILAASSYGFSVYDDFRAKLEAAGVPPREIAFIHDAKTDRQKQALFDRTNRGDVRILMGSTQKMGAGTNVQRRLVALHHLDAPWRPSDLEQREGRILRQGNLFFEQDPNFLIRIMRYAVSRTYDARQWQLIERKAAIVDQVRSASSDVREVDDVIGQAASAAEMKALATGDMRFLEQVELEMTVKRLRALRRSHDARRFDAEHVLSELKKDGGPAAEHTKATVRNSAVLARLAEHQVGSFAITIGKQSTNVHAEGARYLQDAMLKVAHNSAYSGRRMMIGTYRGLTIVASPSALTGVSIELMYDDAPELGLIAKLHPGERISGLGMLTRMDNALAEVTQWQPWADARLERDLARIADLTQLVAAPFRQADELASAQTRLTEVTQLLTQSCRPPSTGGQDGEAGAVDADEGMAEAA